MRSTVRYHPVNQVTGRMYFGKPKKERSGRKKGDRPQPQNQANFGGDVPFGQNDVLEEEEMEQILRFAETTNTPAQKNDVVPAENSITVTPAPIPTAIPDEEPVEERIAHLKAGVDAKLHQGNEDICPVNDD